MASKLRLFCAVALCALLVTACEGESSPEASPADAPTVPTGIAVVEVVNETEAAGDARVSLVVRAHMPPDFDDGQPKRRFTGTGFLDREEDLAGVTFRIDDAPNAAGFFGQVDGKMSVFYGADGFTLSFPLLAEALGSQLDWLRYQPQDFSKPEVRKLGIGQLREVAFSDPRFGLALLRGLPADLVDPSQGSVGQTATTIFTAESDIARAADGAPSTVSSYFEALRQLGVGEAQVRLFLDPLEKVRRVQYRMTYPPAPGSQPVRLDVTLDLLEFGLEGGLTPPPDQRVADYTEYVSR